MSHGQERLQKLVLSTKFALLYTQDNGTLGRCTIYNGPGFPVLLEKIKTAKALVDFQEKFLRFTYHYHGLWISDIMAYELLLPIQGGHRSLGMCYNESQWTDNLANLADSATHHCRANEYCIQCIHPPVLMIYFHRQAWDKALEANKRQLKFNNLTPLDTYCEDYGNLLQNSNERAFKHYIALCHSVRHELNLRGLSAMNVPVPDIRSVSNTSGLQQGRPPATSLSATPLTSLGYIQHDQVGESIRETHRAVPQTADDSQKRIRLLISRNVTKDKPQTAEDFQMVTFQPAGETKLDTEICFTCVHLGRSCNGNQMVNGRCEKCAARGKVRASRKCHWRQPGIDTYEKARAADAIARQDLRDARTGQEECKKTQLHETAETDEMEGVIVTTEQVHVKEEPNIKKEPGTDADDSEEADVVVSKYFLK